MAAKVVPSQRLFKRFEERVILGEMTSRGFTTPLRVATDGNPGVMRAVEDVFPPALRQRYQKHKMSTILGKAPKEAAEWLKKRDPQGLPCGHVRGGPPHGAGGDRAVSHAISGGHGVSGRGPGGLPAEPEAAEGTSRAGANDDLAGTAAGRESPTGQGDPALLRGEGGHEADLRVLVSGLAEVARRAYGPLHRSRVG